MELLKEYKCERHGNDCLIRDYICLIRIDHDLYIVNKVTSVIGGWTGNPVDTYCEHFQELDKALECMNEYIRIL